MKNLSSKIVVTLASLALVGAMYACTNTVTPPEDDEVSEKVESSDSEDVDESSSSIASNSSSSRNDSVDEEDVVATSSSKDKVEEVVIPEKVSDKDTVVAVGKDDIGNKVDESDLPEDLTKGDSLTGGGLYVGDGELDFDKNDYYCKTPDGEWYVLDGSKYNTFWAKLWDAIIKFFTGKSWLDYSKVCDVIYVHPKF